MIVKPHSWRGRKGDVKCRRCGLVRRFKDGGWAYLQEGVLVRLEEGPACRSNVDPELQRALRAVRNWKRK